MFRQFSRISHLCHNISLSLSALEHWRQISLPPLCNAAPMHCRTPALRLAATQRRISALPLPTHLQRLQKLDLWQLPPTMPSRSRPWWTGYQLSWCPPITPTHWDMVISLTQSVEILYHWLNIWFKCLFHQSRKFLYRSFYIFPLHWDRIWL